MGCALSTDIKGPSKRSKVVQRGLTIQVSANFDIIGNQPAPVKALEQRKSLPTTKPSGKGNYAQHKASIVPVSTSKVSSENTSGDTVLGLPISGATLQESRLLAAQKSTASTNENFETVNFLELMEGLAEEEVSFDQWHVHSMPLTQVVDRQGSPPDKPDDDGHTRRAFLTQVVDRQGFLSDKPADDAPTQRASLTRTVDRRGFRPDKPMDDVLTQRASSTQVVDRQGCPPDKPTDDAFAQRVSLTQVVNREGFPSDKPANDSLTQRASLCTAAARMPRPRSFSSFKTVGDVDLALCARRSKSPPPIKSSSKEWPAEAHGKKCSEESFHFPGNFSGTSSQNGTSSRDINVDINRLTSETNSNAADTTASCFDGKPFRNPDNLQRALSFKYMFNDSSIKKQDFMNTDLNPAASQINDIHARVRRGDGLVLATARLWTEGEGASGLFSPAFSPAVSLKDWLPDTNHPSNRPGYSKGGMEPSIHGAFQTFQSYTLEQAAPHCFSHSIKAQPVYSQCVSSQSSSSQYQEETTNLSGEEEGDGIPVFDPEMLDSFENAMKNLSKEEWDAVRGMEDSPRNFLRLVKSLKKSSSNSMRNQSAFSKDQSEPAKPFDMELRRLSAEKKLAFMRQNSLEVKKALAKASIKMDQERASVIFYSSTTQTNTKIFEDCNQVRNILQSLVGVCYDERSISELLEHEQELSYALNVSAVIVPTIYVKGKFLVGVDSIMQLYKKGLLSSMLQESAPFGSNASMQCVCRGGKFLACPFCKGRRKISSVAEGTLLCRYCGGTGLMKCFSCSST